LRTEQSAIGVLGGGPGTVARKTSSVRTLMRVWTETIPTWILVGANKAATPRRSLSM
jgi:hypothetical protein